MTHVIDTNGNLVRLEGCVCAVCDTLLFGQVGDVIITELHTRCYIPAFEFSATEKSSSSSLAME